LNIKPNLHNAAMIIGIAVLGIIAIKLAAKTQLVTVPVLGAAIRFGASA
jgi:hypothetical protein